MSLLRIASGIIVLLFTFIAALYASDGIQNWRIRRNVQYVELGTTADELKAQLGEPTCVTSADIAPRQYWSFGKDSFTDNPDFCGSVLIELSAPPRQVVKVIQ